MVYVPAAEFGLGSDEGDSDGRPVQPVALDALWIDQTEVTNAQFAGYVATARSNSTTAQQEATHTRSRASSYRSSTPMLQAEQRHQTVSASRWFGFFHELV